MGVLPLSPQKIIFYQNLKNSEETVLIMAGKYEIALLTRTVLNKPRNPWVIDAFLRSQINQIANTYEVMRKDVSIWSKLRELMEYILQHPDINWG
jgi:hypothetical protein